MQNKIGYELERKIVFGFSSSAKALSVLLSTTFWLRLGDSYRTEAVLFFIVLGIVFEGTKFLSFDKLLQLFQLRNYIMAILLIPICSLFILLSLFCSISVLHQQINTKQQAALQQDTNYLNQQRAIKIQEEKIAVLQNISTKDTALGYRERAKATILQLADEQATLNDLYNTAATTTHNSTNISILYNLTPTLNKLAILLLGSMLELCTLLLALLERTPSTKNVLYSEYVPAVATSSISLKATTYQANGLEERAWEYIRSTKIKATTRALRVHFNIGSARASQILRNLADQQLLTMRGNRYAIVN